MKIDLLMKTAAAAVMIGIFVFAFAVNWNRRDGTEVIADRPDEISSFTRVF